MHLADELNLETAIRHNRRTFFRFLDKMNKAELEAKENEKLNPVIGNHDF